MKDYFIAPVERLASTPLKRLMSSFGSCWMIILTRDKVILMPLKLFSIFAIESLVLPVLAGMFVLIIWPLAVALIDTNTFDNFFLYGALSLLGFVVIYLVALTRLPNRKLVAKIFSELETKVSNGEIDQLAKTRGVEKYNWAEIKSIDLRIESPVYQVLELEFTDGRAAIFPIQGKGFEPGYHEITEIRIELGKYLKQIKPEKTRF